MDWFNAFDQAVQSWAGGMGWSGEGLLRLLLAATIGAGIGLEREVSGHEAGLRTYTLVCLGCATAMLVSLGFGRVDWHSWPAGDAVRTDTARIAYGVMAGIGFIGAGAILHGRGHVRGLTTAAGIWCTAAIGLAVGLGLYVLACVAGLLVLICLRVFNWVERFLPRQRFATITLRCHGKTPTIDELQRIFGDTMRIGHLDMERLGDSPNDDTVDLNMTVKSAHHDLLSITEQAIKDRPGMSLRGVRSEVE